MISQRWGTHRPARHVNRAFPGFDAFGRFRVSEPSTLFDSKLSFGKLGVLWDEVTLGTATSTHVEVDSCVRMQVNGDGDAVIRQTRQRWNYQAGKSQLILATFRMPVAQGVTTRVGPCHGNYTAPHNIHDGIYFEIANGIPSCCIAKGLESLGIVANECVPQSEWNMDKLNGTGPSGYVMDWSKAQILQVDYQWLGVGGVRFGFEVESAMVYVHEFYHAGIVNSVYMHNGTQPIRYEIRSTGGSANMDHICCSVSSEAGQEKTGVTASDDTDGILINCATGSIQMLMAVRIHPDNPDCQVLLEKVYSLNTANTSYRWGILWNPVITGTPNWVSTTGSPLQTWKNAGTNITMVGGLPLDSGYASRDARQSNQISMPSVSLGVSISGVPDVIALGIESIGGTSSCAGGLGFRQLI